MEPSFWHARWRTHRIGFHNDATHPLLREHWPDQVAAPLDAAVLLPLCGKTLDMLWLQERGWPVVGVELSELAAEAFFAERDWEMQVTPTAIGPVCHAERIGILAADWFQLNEPALSQACRAAEAPGVGAVYDRASLVALPPEMRADYVRRLQQLAGDCPWLLVTVEYDPSLRGGPPFSIFEDEVRQLHAGRDVRLLSRIDSKLRDMTVQEAAYLSLPAAPRST